MQYGKFYVDSMPAGDSSGNTYCRILTGNPNTPGYDDRKGEIDNFTVTQDEEQAYGSLDAAITAYMRRYHPGNDPVHQRRFRNIRCRERRLQRDTYRLILDLLARHGGRITFYPAPDKHGCIDYPVSLLFYGKHNINPSINITDVYLDGDALRMDGFDEFGARECGFILYPEHYAWTLDFIAVALDLRRLSPFGKFISYLRGKGATVSQMLRRKVQEYLECRLVRRAYRRAKLCYEYSTADEVLKRCGLTLSEYGDFQSNSQVGYAYYTSDGRQDNPHGILINYEFRQVGPDNYQSGKILSIEQQ